MLHCFRIIYISHWFFLFSLLSFIALSFAVVCYFSHPLLLHLSLVHSYAFFAFILRVSSDLFFCVSQILYCSFFFGHCKWFLLCLSFLISPYFSCVRFLMFIRADFCVLFLTQRSNAL